MSSSSSYLQAQTDSLEAAQPVPASQARTAQIPLQSFTLPVFPPEAFSSDLTALILTADIKLDEYTSLLNEPFEVPELPRSISSLTLELFSLGYPPGFLKRLGESLPGLKSLTVYSGLLSGTASETRADAIDFLTAQTELTELHLLEVFGAKGFFSDISHVLPSTITFLEISFTQRNSDTAFMNTIPNGAELSGFIKPGLVGLTMRIAEMEDLEEEENMHDDIDRDEYDDEEMEDYHPNEQGLMSAQRTDGEAIFHAVTKASSTLKFLDLTMFALDDSDARDILQSCKGLKVFSLGIKLERGWEELFDVLDEDFADVEVLELIGVPGSELEERIKREGEPGVSREVLERVEQRWLRLRSVKVSVARTEVESWAKEKGRWEKTAFE